MRALFAALALAVLSLGAVAPANAAMERVAALEGRLVQISALSVGVIDRNSGKIVHFMLEAPFEDAFRSDEKTMIPLDELRTNSIVKIIYDQARGGPRRAEKIIVLKRP